MRIRLRGEAADIRHRRSPASACRGTAPEHRASAASVSHAGARRCRPRIELVAWERERGQGGGGRR